MLDNLSFSTVLKEIKRYFVFITGGAISTLISIAITFILTEAFKLWHMIGVSLALFAEIIFQFIYHSRVTFKSKGRFKVFAVLLILLSGLYWLLVYLLSVRLEIHYIPSIILASFAVSILNYTLNKQLVFNPKKKNMH